MFWKLGQGIGEMFPEPNQITYVKFSNNTVSDLGYAMQG